MSEVRQLRAVNMLMAEHMQTAASVIPLAPYLWIMKWKILEDDNEQAMGLFEQYGDFSHGFVRLSFYKNTKLMFDIILNIYKSRHTERRSFLQELDQFHCAKDLDTHLLKLNCELWYPEQKIFKRMKLVFDNSVMTIVFRDGLDYHTDRFYVYTDRDYHMIMTREHVFETFTDLTQDIREYIDKK